MKTRIQIIDDNVSLTTLLAKALFKFGYDPVVENNPLLAINTARHYMPDLILLDVMMPERDGGRVLADLRADLSLRYIPVILLTGIAREAQGLADTGGIKSPVIAKPVEIKELIEAIEFELKPDQNSMPDNWHQHQPTSAGKPQAAVRNAISAGNQDVAATWDRTGNSPAGQASAGGDANEFVNPSDSGFSADFPASDFSFPSPDEETGKENPW